MKQNLENEKIWHRANPWINRKHWLMKWPFVHPSREGYANDYARKNVRKLLFDYLKKTTRRIDQNIYQKLLVAPCGNSADQDILSGLAEEYYGIDVSREALDQCPKYVVVKEADILENGYRSDYFDMVASFLFFHHLHKVGFEPFLKEFYRVLKKDGILVILEPSALYPLSWLTKLGRRIFGNISGLVPDEAPIIPANFNSLLDRNGFKIEKLQSVSFSHNRITLPLQYLINLLTRPLQGFFPFNRAGWMCVWICSKI